MIGIAVVAPFALIFLTRGGGLKISAEFLFQVVAILVSLGLVFLYAEQHHFQLFYVLFLPIVWMAVRGGLESVTVGILLTQIGLILGLQLFPKDTVDVTAFQALMLVLATTGLVAGVLVTEHRRTEFQLRLHQDSLARVARLGSMGELAAAVAHEINQPLMAAGTYTRLVADTLREGKSEGSVLDTATKAVSQVERAAEVVRHLRALIRLDRSGRAPTSVERIVRETLQLCQPDLNRQSVKTAVALDPNLPQVMVDLLQIEQVLLNLIRNSVEAMSLRDDLARAMTISASVLNPDYVAMEIRDTGPGFPPEFGQAGFLPLSSNKAEGLGLGLSLCRSIIEAHGGKFSCENAAPGAMVRITLPIARSSNG
jgi:C4-dicarboxylate-specific signal transduction histidine kinase